MTAMLALLACIPVDGPRILGADVASTGLLPQLAPGAVLGHAPAPGVRRVFPLQSLRRIAVRHGLATPVRGEICVERRVAPLEPVRLEKAMRRALDEPDAEIDITEYSRFAAPTGDIVFRRQDLRAPRAGSADPVLWRGYIAYDTSRRFSVWARVRVTVPVTRIVARSDIPAGALIERSHLESRTSRAFPSAHAEAAIEALLGKRARRLIPAGAGIAPRLLQAEPVVRKGQEVQVRVARGAAALSLVATAQADAQLGQPVALRNRQSGKVFRGRVEAPGLVAIEP